MSLVATRILRTMLLAVLTAVLMCAGGPAGAQVNPEWDHYHVYTVAPKPTLGLAGVTLIDQFGATTHTVEILNLFANPVQKQHGALTYGIHHPELHYTWWTINEQPFSKEIIASNQFGDQGLHLGPIVYLLNPALKNGVPGQPLPVGNHYKVYEATGNPVNIPVGLIDQFWGRQAVVGFPRYFCCPADKRTPDGQIHPMVDPKQHYTVYEIEPLPTPFSATVRDQFLFQNPQLAFPQSVLLMVPTDKILPTPGASPTWGRLKTLYR
jgi:hypothetical protein